MSIDLEGFQQIVGSHSGGLVGLSHHSIHEHVFTATNIVSKANVGGTEEQNPLSNFGYIFIHFCV